MRVFENMPEQYQDREERSVLGFNLHASIGIAADDRQGLLRLLRYMGRPPLSEDRLSKTSERPGYVFWCEAPKETIRDAWNLFRARNKESQSPV